MRKSSSNWVAILQLFYETPDGRIRSPPPDNISDDHYLVEGSDLTLEEVKNAVDFLTDTGLLEYDKQLVKAGKSIEFEEAVENPVYTVSNDTGTQHVRYIRLTKEGFEVAHEQLQENQRQETNSAIKDFTLFLVMISIIQAIPNVYPATTPNVRLGLLVLLGFLALSVGLTGESSRTSLQRLRNRLSGLLGA